MRVMLREVEPFNIPSVDNTEAERFTKHLTGSETFDFDGIQKPHSIMVYSLKYNYPKHSFANGWLLSVDIDTFSSICNSSANSTMDSIAKKYIIGSITIEHGGNLAQTRISAQSFDLSDNLEKPIPQVEKADEPKTGNCPVCMAPVDPMNYNWKCPVCSKFHSCFTIFSVCEGCKFGPRLMDCPTCQEKIEGMLLIGGYEGKQMKVVSYDKLVNKPHHSYKLRQLDAKIMESVTTEQLQQIGEKAMLTLMDTEIKSPIQISRFLLHTLHKDSNGISWLHGWGYSSANWKSEPEEPTVQISIRYPSVINSSTAIAMIVDALVEA